MRMIEFSEWENVVVVPAGHGVLAGGAGQEADGPAQGWQVSRSRHESWLTKKNKSFAELLVIRDILARIRTSD
jgi:hypothetical protein